MKATGCTSRGGRQLGEGWIRRHKLAKLSSFSCKKPAGEFPASRLHFHQQRGRQNYQHPPIHRRGTFESLRNYNFLFILITAQTIRLTGKNPSPSYGILLHQRYLSQLNSNLYFSLSPIFRERCAITRQQQKSSIAIISRFMYLRFRPGEQNLTGGKRWNGNNGNPVKFNPAASSV